MKVKLDEQQLKAYINEAVQQELDEILGLSRAERNAKWGYEWDPNLSAKQNRRNRNVNKALIKQRGYRNHDEYQAGEGHAFGQNPEPQQGPQEAEPQYPGLEAGQPAPFAQDKHKVGQFQTWFNQNCGGKLVVDGIWGPKTQGAFDQWLSQQRQVSESKETVKTLSENEFKDLVKNTLNELLNK